MSEEVERGDDIGISNLSCYSHGLMVYQTPNIDRIAKKGDCGYRSSSISGQIP